MYGRDGEINHDPFLMRMNMRYPLHILDRSNCAPLLKRRLRTLPMRGVTINLRGGPDYDALADRLRTVYRKSEDA